jgi:hypothetical protein
MVRDDGQALNAAGRAGQRGEHQQEDQREGELGAARHRVQFSLPGLFAVDANFGGSSQAAVVGQQLRDGEEEEPETDHGGEDAQNEHRGAALVQMRPRSFTRIEIRIGDPAKPDAGAEGGHEQEGDAHDNADVEHNDSSFSAPGMRASRL